MRLDDILEVRISARIADKLWAKHSVAEEEVYEVIENEEDLPRLRRSNAEPGSYLVYGRTLAGRYLVVALFPKGRGVVNVATARDMTAAERKLYGRK
ncbi:MAG TPA: hypothetical protein VGB77_01820 [Abditibacteriaceae bacterium]|jgi:uncharacterized DUF497 family protein